MGILTIGLLGGDGGKVLSMWDGAVVVPFGTTAPIHEPQILIGHTWCGLSEQGMGPANVKCHSPDELDLLLRGKP